MSDGQPKSHIARFVALAALASLALGIPLLIAGWQTSSRLLYGLLYTLAVGVPAWSVIIAALGFPLSRKLQYGLGLLAFLLVFDLIAFWTGVQALALGSLALSGAREGALAAAYRLALMASPFVTLVLFVGKKPVMLWTSRGT